VLPLGRSSEARPSVAFELEMFLSVYIFILVHAWVKERVSFVLACGKINLRSVT